MQRRGVFSLLTLRSLHLNLPPLNRRDDDDEQHTAHGDERHGDSPHHQGGGPEERGGRNVGDEEDGEVLRILKPHSAYLSPTQRSNVQRNHLRGVWFRVHRINVRFHMCVCVIVRRLESVTNRDRRPSTFTFVLLFVASDVFCSFPSIAQIVHAPFRPRGKMRSQYLNTLSEWRHLLTGLSITPRVLIFWTLPAL